jgi:hypothetical protein
MPVREKGIFEKYFSCPLAKLNTSGATIYEPGKWLLGLT